MIQGFPIAPSTNTHGPKHLSIARNVYLESSVNQPCLDNQVLFPRVDTERASHRKIGEQAWAKSSRRFCFYRNQDCASSRVP